jgi:hypothetical protein
VFVANGGGLEKIVGVFLCFCFGNVFLDVLVEANGLMEIDGFEVIEVDVVIDLNQFFLLFVSQGVEGFLFRDEVVAQEAALPVRYILASRVFSPAL